MNVLEGNKLIAEFLGGKYQFGTPIQGGMGIEQWFFSFDISPSGSKYFGLEWPPDELQFHSNWNWLMPVVEKIQKIVILQNDEFCIEFYEDLPGKPKTFVSIGELRVENKSSITAVWKAVVKFIQSHV